MLRGMVDRWQDLKEKAREEWPALTDEDLTLAGGDREKLADMVRERYGIDRPEAERLVDEWERRNLAA